MSEEVVPQPDEAPADDAGCMELLPFIGVGTLRLGLSLAEMQMAADAGVTVQNGPLILPSLRGGNVQLDLRQGKVEFIEVYEPEDVEMAGLRLTGEPVEAVLRALADQDVLPDEIDGDNYYFYERGFTLSADERSVVSACACFSRGYYSAPE